MQEREDRGILPERAHSRRDGAAMSVRWTYIEPQIVFNPFIVFQTVLVATIGGPTRLIGPILGAAVFGLCRKRCGSTSPTTT